MDIFLSTLRVAVVSFDGGGRWECSSMSSGAALTPPSHLIPPPTHPTSSPSFHTHTTTTHPVAPRWSGHSDPASPHQEIVKLLDLTASRSRLDQGPKRPSAQCPKNTSH